MSRVFGALKGKLTAITVGLVAGGIAIKKAFDFVGLGASIQKQKDAFENLAKSHGGSANQILFQLRQVSKGTIDTLSLMNTASKALVLGIAPAKLTKLMEIARAASKATGDTITKSFNDIVVGLARQSRLILDNLGIIIRVEDANKRYAEALGKTAGALSDTEKRQAFMNATIEAGQKIINSVGEDFLSNADRLDIIKTSFINAKNAAAEFFTTLAFGTPTITTLSNLNFAVKEGRISIEEAEEAYLRLIGAVTQTPRILSAQGLITEKAEKMAEAMKQLLKGIGVTTDAQALGRAQQLLQLVADIEDRNVGLAEATKMSIEEQQNKLNQLKEQLKGTKVSQAFTLGEDIAIIEREIGRTEDILKRLNKGAGKVFLSSKNILQLFRKIVPELRRGFDLLGKKEQELAKSIIEQVEALEKEEEQVKKNLKTKLDALKEQKTQQELVNSAFKTNIQLVKQELDKLEDRLSDAVAFTQTIKQMFAQSDKAIAQQGFDPVEKIIDDVERSAVALKNVNTLLKQNTIASIATAKQILTNAAKSVTAFQKANTTFGKAQLQSAGFSTQGLTKMAGTVAQIKTFILQSTQQLQTMAQQAIPPVAAQLGSLQSQMKAGQNTLAGIEQAIKDLIMSAQELKDKLNEDTTSTHTTIMKTVQGGQAQGNDFVGPPAPGMATGGSLPGGYGGGDRIPILGEAGEFMLRKEAVRDLGLKAAVAFNNRDLAGLLASLTAPVQRLRAGGPVQPQGPSEEVNLNLNLSSGDTLQTRAPRDKAKQFIKNLKTINIIHGRGKRPY